MKSGGKEMLQALYSDCLLDASENLPNCDVTLGIDTTGMEKTAKVKKTMSEEE